jgi:NAD(P)-dependent dehydrogenase (short-subunit alcohol dehydrogenase family)
MPAALVVGNSDGIGRALTGRLLAEGWTVTGISRRPVDLASDAYTHHVLDVADPGYQAALEDLCPAPLDLCVYCAGIGDPFDAADLAAERRTFAVNLMGAVSTVEVVAARMRKAGGGHVIGLSSLADQVVSPQAPAYAASKAGLSSYLTALAFALKPFKVYVTTVRFGFVDTKMAKSPVKPALVCVPRAVDVLMRAIRTKPVRLSYPRRMAVLTDAARRLTTVRLWLS